MTEKVKVYSANGVTEHEIRNFVELFSGCCVIRVSGYADNDPQGAWRWINMDLLSDHDVRASWRRRFAYAWHILRHGRAYREFIEIIRKDEADDLLTALTQARDVAFGPVEEAGIDSPHVGT